MFMELLMFFFIKHSALGPRCLPTPMRIITQALLLPLRRLHHISHVIRDLRQHSRRQHRRRSDLIMRRVAGIIVGFGVVAGAFFLVSEGRLRHLTESDFMVYYKDVFLELSVAHLSNQILVYGRIVCFLKCRRHHTFMG